MADIDSIKTSQQKTTKQNLLKYKPSIGVGTAMDIALKDKVKILRNTHNLTQEKMAEKLEISIPAYQLLENGETKILSKNLTKILEVFDITILEFLSIGEKGFVCLINENSFINSHNNSHITFGSISTDNLQKEKAQLEQIVQLQQKRINDLETIVQLLKQQDQK